MKAKSNEHCVERFSGAKKPDRRVKSRSILLLAVGLGILLWATGGIGQSGPSSGFLRLWPGYLRGNVTSVAVSGNYAYVGMTLHGPGGCSRGWRGRLEVIDISDPNHPLWLNALNFREPFVRLQASNDVLCAAAGQTLSVFSVTNPAAPSLIGQCETSSGDIKWFQLRGQYVYAVEDGHLDVFDISNPGLPALASSTNGFGSGSGIQVADNYAYVAAGNGLQVFDVSVPAQPVLLTTNQDSTANAQAVDVAGGNVYLTTSEGLKILAITNPAQPIVVGTNVVGAYGNRILTAGQRCYVTVGNRLNVLDVTNSAQPTSMGGYETGGPISDLALADHYAFVAAGAEGLQILDLANPASPAFVATATRETGGPAEAIQVVGNYAYLADGDSGLQVIDLADTNGLVRVGRCWTTNYARAVCIIGTNAYVGTDTGLQIIDVSNPTNPVCTGALDAGQVEDIEVVSNTAYLAAGNLVVVDVSNPGQPSYVTNCNFVSSTRAVQVVGQLAYVAGYASTESNSANGLIVVDVSNPIQPFVAGFCATVAPAQDVQIVGNLAYVIVSEAPNMEAGHPQSWLQVIDVSNPIQPVPLGQCPISEDAQAVQVVGNYAYIAGGSWREDAPEWRDGLMMVDVSDPANPTRVCGFTTPGWAGGIQVVGDQVYLADGPAGLAALTLPAVPTGPLTVEVKASWTNVVVGSEVDLTGWIDGWAAASVWDFGDGTTLSNRLDVGHAWAAPGDYSVVLRAYNESNPVGVSATSTVHVVWRRVTLEATFTNVVVGYPVGLTALIEGAPSMCAWDFGNGETLTNGSSTTHAWNAPGDYVAAIRAYGENDMEGVSATVTVHVVTQPTYYVAVGNTNPVPPYTSWATAATNIQDAVDVADVADVTWLPPGSVLVLVTNGVYATGGRTTGTNLLENRVAVDRPITVRSVNGPEVTIIQGYQVPGTTNGVSAVRSVYLSDGASLAGFAVTKGATRAIESQDGCGGGVYCDGYAMVSNCVLVGNSARYGGGAYGGTLNNCTLATNSAHYGGGAYQCILNKSTFIGNSVYADPESRNCLHGGGASDSTLHNCVLTGNSVGPGSGGGGGAAYSYLDDCTLTGNSANVEGGGTWYCWLLNNCTLTGNSADYAGGAFFGTLNNCVLVGNSARLWGGGARGLDNSPCTLNNCTLIGNSADVGGGTHGATLNNCIVYFNTARTGANYSGTDFAPVVLNYSCTTPLPTNGVGNITNAPLLVNYVGGNLRLQSTSPCINAGNNTYAPGPTDLDGNPRIVSGTVDIGAYEFQGPGSRISYAWLQHYGLPTDGSADATDPDADGHTTWQEWRCGTCPTNALSVLRLLSASPDGTNVTVHWQSVAGVSYFVERSTNLSASPRFTLIATNLIGQPDTTSYVHTNAAGSGAWFFRVGVQCP